MFKKLSIWLIVFAIMATGAFGVGVYPLTEQERANTHANWMVKITHEDLTTTATNTAQTLTNVFAVAAKQGVELVAMVLKTPFEDEATNAFNSTTLIVGDGTDDDLFLASTELNKNGTEVWVKFGRTTWDSAATTAFVTNVADATAAGVTGVVDTTANAVTGVTDTTASYVISVADATAAGVTGIVDATDNFMTNLTLLTCAFTNAVGEEVQGVTGITIHVSSAVTATTPSTRDFVTGTTAATALGVSNTVVATSAFVTGTTPSTRNFVTGTTASTANGLNATVAGHKLYTTADYVDFKITPNASYGLAALDKGEVWLYLHVWDAR